MNPNLVLTKDTIRSPAYGASTAATQKRRARGVQPSSGVGPAALLRGRVSSRGEKALIRRVLC
jgi:hypothetical protein